MFYAHFPQTPEGQRDMLQWYDETIETLKYALNEYGTDLALEWVCKLEYRHKACQKGRSQRFNRRFLRSNAIAATMLQKDVVLALAVLDTQRFSK